MSTAAERQEATFSNSMVSMASTLTRSTTATASAMQTLNTSLTRAMMNKKSTTVHAWHGGCSSTQNGGWNNLCLDRNTYDNAMPYFRKRDNTRFLVVDARVIIFYNFFTINSSCNWAYSDLLINNALWYRTHGHTTGWSWKDSHGKAPWYRVLLVFSRCRPPHSSRSLHCSGATPLSSAPQIPLRGSDGCTIVMQPPPLQWSRPSKRSPGIPSGFGPTLPAAGLPRTITAPTSGEELALVPLPPSKLAPAPRSCPSSPHTDRVRGGPTTSPLRSLM